MDLFSVLKIASDCLFCGCAVETIPSAADSHSTEVFTQYPVKLGQLPIICYQCHTHLPFCINNCLVCGLPLTPLELQASSLSSPCGECLKNSPAFDHTVSIFHYQAPINRLITQLKYASQFRYLPLLSSYLVAKISHFYRQQSLPQALVPVPLHPSKLKARGFNQSSLIAAELQKRLNIPILTSGVIRHKKTFPQSDLDAKQRQKNLKNAFQVLLKPPSHIAIIDDVVTTGATASELAKVLRLAGAKQVDVWSLARAYDI
ncbi:MAG: ComF family protein [Enterobacterales bacterium]|nr:ComF family protein [Enterobacterales bacterium]